MGVYKRFKNSRDVGRMNTARKSNSREVGPMTMMRKFLVDESGATAIEYGLIAAANSLGTRLSTKVQHD